MIGCRPLSNDEFKAINEKFKRNRDLALFNLNYYSGYRIAESLSLKVSDVYSNGAVHDRVRVMRRNMKGKVRSRDVILHARVKTLLLNLIVSDDLKPDDYLFQSRKGLNRPISRIQAYRVLKAVVNSLGMQGKIALHSTRKSFAERIYKAFDKDLVKTSKALGHRSVLSTMSYLSFNTEEIDNAILLL